MRKVLVALLVVAFVATSGCAWFRKAPTVDAQQAAYAQVKKAADVIDAAGKIVASTQQMEIALYQAGVVPQNSHLAIQQGYKKLATDVQAGLLVLRDLTRTPMEQQAAITQIETSLKTFISSVAGLSDATNQKVSALLDAALLMVQGALLMI